jgi:hypothetical protein
LAMGIVRPTRRSLTRLEQHHHIGRFTPRWALPPAA